MAQVNLKKIVGIAALPTIALGWVLFRPELALVNKTVNEQAPNASTSQSLSAGTFASFAHETTGKASVLLVDGKQILRLSDFKTSNGPDVRVLLVKGKDSQAFGNDYLDLGVIKGNIGDQNYVIPAGTDISSYGAVSIWCKRFNVTFGGATLESSRQTSLRTPDSQPNFTEPIGLNGEIKVTSGKFAGANGSVDLIENSGRRFLRLNGVSKGSTKEVMVYLVKKETFSARTDFDTVTKTSLGMLKSGKTQELAVSKELDLWLYRSVVLWDVSAKKVLGFANLRSAQESKTTQSFLLI